MPEQVWDEADLPERSMRQGQPAGSAVPLVWAHAEYLKLLRSAVDGKVFDRIDPVYERYCDAGRAQEAQDAIWRSTAARGRFSRWTREARCAFWTKGCFEVVWTRRWLEDAEHDGEPGLGQRGIQRGH